MEAAAMQGQQQPPGRACPRCDSTHTKFCYYNNYSLTQPRYFCRGCRRYWTHGGSLRQVPVGGATRKRRRSSPTPPPAFNHSSIPPPPPPYFPFQVGGVGGVYSSLLTTSFHSMNLPVVPPGIGAFPGSLPTSSHFANFFQGFEFGAFDWGNVFDQKPAVSTGAGLPVTGDGGWGTGGGGGQGGGDSAFKEDYEWTDFLGGDGNDNDK